MNQYAKPKSKTVDGIKWVFIPQIELEPRKIEWACSEWGSVRVVRTVKGKEWSIKYIHRIEASGYDSADEAMADAAAIVREVASKRVADAKDRGFRTKFIRELERRAQAVAVPVAES